MDSLTDTGALVLSVVGSHDVVVLCKKKKMQDHKIAAALYIVHIYIIHQISKPSPRLSLLRSHQALCLMQADLGYISSGL